MKVHQWVERVSLVVTFGLLGLIVYEQTEIVARVSQIHLQSTAKSFALTPAPALVPLPSRRPRPTPRSPVTPEPRLRNGTVRPPRERLADTAPESPSLASLASHLTVVPDSVHGVPVGVRLFGIRSNSLLGLIGLQNGDRLDSINGFSVATPQQALEAYAQLRTASRLEVTIERRGRPLVITYLLV